jgi:hypothetical protein
MEEDHGEKAEFGETGHFRAGVINRRSGLGRTFGNANICIEPGWDIQTSNTLQCHQRHIRDAPLHDRPIDLIWHTEEVI